MDTKKIIMGVATVGIIGGAGYALANSGSKQEAAVAVSTNPASPGATEATTPAPKYKDGTWSADGTYNSPGGEQKVHVELVLSDGKIVDAKFSAIPVTPADKFNQEKFSKGFKQEVVGKNIDDVNLDVVNGSSLTPKGFMDALGQVKAEAKP